MRVRGDGTQAQGVLERREVPILAVELHIAVELVASVLALLQIVLEVEEVPVVFVAHLEEQLSSESGF